MRLSPLLLVAAALVPVGAAAAPPEPCSLDGAVPATVAAVDDDFDLLLDDGRRAALAGLDFPPPPAKGAADLRAAARKRLSDWLVGRDVFVGAFSAGPDRWGRVPARVFAAQEETKEAPLTPVADALLAEGLARFRPDPPAAPCAKAYLSAEAPARRSGRGLWSDPAMRPVDAAFAGLAQRQGMMVVEGVISGVGESRTAVYLNFGQKRAENFAVVILRRNLAMFERSGIEPRTLLRRRARVRGLIETGVGPRMEVSAPAEIEFVEDGQ